MRKKMRLSRIEDECARIRRPPRVTSSVRPVLRAINSCPVTNPVLICKDICEIQDRFGWLCREKETGHVYCSICISRVDRAPLNLSKTTRTEVKWQVSSPRGRSLVPKVELHAFSSLHAWSSAVHVSELPNSLS